MNHFLNGVARAVAETFVLPEPILEIGSYQVAGQEELINLRSLFPGRAATPGSIAVPAPAWTWWPTPSSCPRRLAPWAL